MSPEHIHHPYPTKEEKISLIYQTNISIRQLNYWFKNARRRQLNHVLANNKKNSHLWETQIYYN